MRLLKLCLTAALAVGWWQLWHAKDDVVAAYTDDRAPLALELTGVGSAAEATSDNPSPYALVPAGPDRSPTRLPGTTATVAGDDEPVTIAVTGGDARLSGTVRLPDGRPVAGATIRIERFTSLGEGTAETVSGADGSWSASGLRGGRLRVRAFAPNELATVDAVVLVVTQSGSTTLDLQVQTATDGLRFDMVGPPGIVLGTNGTVALVVSREVVDDQGRLVRVPVVGQSVEVGVNGSGRLLSERALVTDAGGAVRILVACEAAGAPVATLVVGDDRPALALPSCMSAAELAALEAELEAAAELEAEQQAQLVDGELEP